MTISISNDGSYFSIGYIDYNYIAPDILVLGATSVSSVAPSLSLSLNLTALSSNVGSLGIINTSTNDVTLVGIESISQLGSLRLELSDNTNPNQINANISSVSVQLSTQIQSSTVLGNIGSVEQSTAVGILSAYGQSDVGNLTASSQSTTSVQLSGLYSLSNVGSNLASIQTPIDGNQTSVNPGSVNNTTVSSISSATSQSDIGSVGIVVDGSITLGLTGIPTQFFVSSIAKFIDCSTSGTLSQTDVGYVLSLHQTTSTGATTSVGSIGFNVDHAITGSITNTSISNILLSKSEFLLGNQSNSSVNSLSNNISLGLTGQYTTSSVSSVTKTLTVGLLGTTGTTSVNSVSVLDSTALASNIVTTGLGILGYAKSDSAKVLQVDTAISSGTVSTNISISVSGITSYGLVRSEVPVQLIVPPGNQAVISQGTFTVSSSSTVNLTSVLATTSIHSIDTTVSRVANSYHLSTNIGSVTNSSDIATSNIQATIVQQSIFATHTLESTGFDISTDVGSVVKTFGAQLYVDPLIGYTGNLNKYSTTSIFGSSSSVSNGNVSTNLLASLYNPTLVTSLGYFAGFIESDDIYYYGPIQFELINSNIIPFTITLPLEAGFNDTKNIETKFNTVFEADTEFKNTKSFKGVCL